MSLADLGTVRLFDKNGLVEVFSPRGDVATRDLLKTMKARFDGSRKSWIIDPAYARVSVEEITRRITDGVLSETPVQWQQMYEQISRLVCTTKKFDISVGVGGIRVELPRGHKHEYTLKAHTHLGVEPHMHQWLIPARVCDDPKLKQVLIDIIKEDDEALGKCVNYLDEFTLAGVLKMTPDDFDRAGIMPGKTVCAQPIFVRTADPKTPIEHSMKLYPFRVMAVESLGGGTYPVKLAFITNMEGGARKALLSRLGKKAGAKLNLDVQHLEGKWVRRRG